MQSRRTFLRDTLTLTAAVTAGTILPTPVRAAKTNKKKRPNIVWLISEDNSKHFLKLYDKEGAKTPNIEKLAQTGVVFNHAFSNCAVCSAARSVLATGCYGSRIGTQFHRKFKTVPLQAGLAPIPALMREAGYYTSNKTKTDYNFHYKAKPTWNSKSTWTGRNKGQPFFHKQSFPVSHESRLQAANKGGLDKGYAPECYPDTPLFRQAHKAYCDIHVKMDAEIGAVIDNLTKDGLLDDTFVFYFGDHGGVMPASKGYLYERGLWVPLVIHIPENFKHLVDLKPNTRADGFVSFIDFAPTILNLCGIDIPKMMDGKPFMGPDVTKADLEQRDETFGIADRFDEKYDLVRTLRKGKFKYMRSYQPFNFDGLMNVYRYKMASYREWFKLYKAGKLKGTAAEQFYLPRSPEALYDIDADPFETKNLAGDPAHAKTLAALRENLSGRMKAMPDLSLFPESELMKSAFGNPVKFGQTNKARIGELVDIADLSLVSFAKAEAGITAALASTDPWKRYWGLIVCSCFGNEAKGFVDTAKKIAANDSEPLVRVRAAEFLGLISAQDPQPVILDVLGKSKSYAEVVLVLNTVVLLTDGKPGYKFDIPKGLIKQKDKQISNRLGYLGTDPNEPATAPTDKKNKKKKKWKKEKAAE
ncbi:MAG: sulfatase [Phycisphaerales bacterium]|jgi:arylsulfatase A-like enzyme|nr:sulfatase [Phycisphaerales bacterium]MBT7170178.1 sulfatase [Phycisphaerales bacterium]